MPWGRGRDDMTDWEFERRMEDAHRRQGGDGGGFSGGGSDDLIVWVVGLLIGAAVVLAGAGWLDEQFGWGVRDWIIARFTNS